MITVVSGNRRHIRLTSAKPSGSIRQLTRLTVLDGGGEHRGVAGRFEPASGRELAQGRENPEGVNAPRRKLFHRLVGSRAERVHDRRPHEMLVVKLDHIKHVSVVKTIEAHLNQVDAGDPRRFAEGEQLLGGERPGHHVLDLEARRQRVMADVGRPDVRMRVDVRAGRRSHGFTFASVASLSFQALSVSTMASFG